MGHVPADWYGIYAQQAAFMMKLMDKSIELVICGSSGIQNDTYMEWDRQVLDYVGDAVDYISLHRYVDNLAEDTPDYLAITNSIDQQIEEMDAACRFVQAKRRSRKRAYLCFDEWNAWYRENEALFNLEDALVVSGFLNSFVRHADVLKIANIAQIVNVIAPVLTRGDDVLAQTIFYPLEMFTRRRTGISLHPAVTGPGYEGKTNGYVHYIDTSAILEDDRLHVFVTNRSLNETAPVTVAVADRGIVALESAEILAGASPKITNSFEQPEVIRSRPFSDVQIADGKSEIRLPPLSFAALTFRLKAGA
jgi:alpha-N-arabinofuranosidase